MQLSIEKQPNNRFAHYLRTRLTEWITDWKKPPPFDWRAALACIVGGVALTPITILLPVLGHDWFVYFTTIPSNDFAVAYPPWTDALLTPLTLWPWRVGLAIMNGLLFMTVAVATRRETGEQGRVSRYAAIVLALLTAPIFMLLWQGNVAGLVLLGITILPLGLPLALLQPHLAVWAIIARRRWFLWAAGFGILTLLLWGWWPSALWGSLSFRFINPLAMGWTVLGWPLLLLGLAMLFFSNADPLRLMAAGAFVTPYVMPMHFVVLLPAIGRVKGWKRLVLWVCAWFTLLPSMFITDEAKLACMLFPFAVWWLLRPQGQDEGVNSHRAS